MPSYRPSPSVRRRSCPSPTCRPRRGLAARVSLQPARRLPPGLPPYLEDVQQHEEIENTDHPEERAGYAGADDAAQIMQARQITLDGRRSKDDGYGKCEDDRRMTQRKEEPDAEQPLAFLQHVTHRIVDSRDMVRIEGVPQPEHIGDETEADQCGIMRRIVDEQPASENVQECDDAVESGNSNPLVPRKC